jgi:uncharacterized protein YndB with AHSA1/START domain
VDDCCVIRTDSPTSASAATNRVCGTPAGATAPEVSAREGTHSTQVAAPPRAVFDALVDYDRIPDWQGPLRACEVLDRDADGLGRVVAYEVDAVVRTVRYRLRHEYDPPHRISSTYAGGDFRDCEGEYRLEPDGDGTCVTFRLRIDPGRFVPGRIVRMVNERVLRQSVEDLRRHVEADAAPS